MIQLIFGHYSGRPVPVAPRDRDGAPREPDGDVLLSLEQAASHFGIEQSILRDVYSTTLGALLSEADATELNIARPTGAAIPPAIISREDRDLLKRLHPGFKDEHLDLLVQMAVRRGLDPIKGGLIPRYTINPVTRKTQFVIITRIDVFRALASASGKYIGPVGSEFCGADGIWKSIWNRRDGYPVAARHSIYVKGLRKPCSAIAHWDTYAQFELSEQTGERILDNFWREKPDVMLPKCAESLVLRQVCAEVLGGLYTVDEMGQVDNPPPQQAPLPSEAEGADDDPDVIQMNKQTGEIISKYPGELTEAALRSRLIDLGIPAERQDLLIEMFQRKMWRMYQSRPTLFYAAVFERISENPQMYRLKVG